MAVEEGRANRWRLVLAGRAGSDCARTMRADDSPPARPARVGKNRLAQRLVWIAVLVSSAACAGPEPLLRSNKQLQIYGKEMGQQEVEACQQRAEAAGLRSGVHRSANAGAGAALGLTLGAVVGASAGLIGGVPGIAIGAAAGGGLGLIIGLVGGAYKPLVPETPYADAVVRCLIEKGYEVSGWD